MRICAARQRKRSSARQRKRKRSSSDSETAAEDESEEEEIDEGLEERSKLELELDELCTADSENVNWAWPVFSEDEYGSCKFVATPDMTLTIYATKANDRPVDIAKAQGVEIDPMIELCMYFNDGIKELSANDRFEKNTLLVVAVGMKKAVKGVKRRKTQGRELR